MCQGASWVIVLPLGLIFVSLNFRTFWHVIEMKILLVGPSNPYRGGIAMFNERLAQSLVQQGHSVELINFSLQYPSFLFPGATQYTDAAPPAIPMRRMVSSVNPFSWCKTAKYIKQQKPDLVIFRYWMPFFAPSLGTIARRLKRKGIKTVAITDNIVPHEKHFYDRPMTRYFLKGIDRVVHMSGEVGEQLREFKFKGENRFSPHPIYDIYGQSVERELACERLGIDPKENYSLFFGFIRGYKGLDLLLDAWGEIKDKKLIIAGEFYEDKEKYMQQIERLGLSDRVILHDRYIAESEVALYFSAADLVVQPYRTATQSGITQIAYHFEVPMVVTAVGGLPEIVPDGRVGYVVERDPEKITQAVERFYTENKAEEFRENIKVDKSKFSWESFVEAVITK